MFLITTAENLPAALVNQYEQDESGVWIWMGHFAGAKVTPLTEGTIIPQWVLWTRDDHTRTDLEVVKVNKVTIKVKAADDGKVYSIRIDR